MTIVERLRGAGCVFAEDEAAILEGSAIDAADLERMVELRISGLPLEHVVGWVEFAGHRFAIDPGVFVPRPRTEFLVEQIVAIARPGGVVLDLCCGSGAIGAALASALHSTELYASDSDAAAVATARRNVDPQRVFHGDLYDALPDKLKGTVDTLVVIAPYVPTDAIGLLPHEARDFEPLATLDGGADGLDILRRLLVPLRHWLAPGGLFATEVSDEQAPELARLVAAAGLVPTVIRDDDLDATVVVGHYR